MREPCSEASEPSQANSELMGYFSAKPKINIDITQIEREGECQSSGGFQIPPPLHHGRNGQGSRYNLYNHPLYCPIANDCEDSDHGGRYFGASIRRGPFMNK